MNETSMRSSQRFWKLKWSK